MRSRRALQLSGLKGNSKYAMALSIAGLVALALGCNLAGPADSGDESSATAARVDIDSPVSPVSPSAPAHLEHRGSGRGHFYPLDLGSRWEYARTFRAQVIPDGGEPEPPEVFETTIEREIIGTEELFERSYAVQRDREVDADRASDEWTRYRQDRRGLYQADVPLNQPPAAAAAPAAASGSRGTATLARAQSALAERLAARGMNAAYLAALDDILERLRLVRGVVSPADAVTRRHGRRGGPLSDEIVELQYPLHRGASWLIREVPLFEATVEGRDKLDLPVGRRVGIRIRIESGLFGPQDEVLLWYDRCGQLQLSVHAEAEATDLSGQRVGLLIVDETMALVAADLGRRGCSR